MALTGALATDRRRGVAACFHYRRALELELVRRRREQAGERRQLHVERMIREHARIARGYLGAVGFERRSRL